MTPVSARVTAWVEEIEKAHAAATNGANYAIISEAAKCGNTSRPLTHLLDLGERGLAVKATHEPTPIPDFPGYGVTPDGRVWSLSSNWRGYGARPLTAFPDQSGYLRVHLQVDGRRAKRTVHSLVLSTLVGPKPSPDHQVRHLNGEKTDNRLVNLAWGTAAENAADRERHGTTAWGTRNGFSRWTEEEIREIRRRYADGELQREIAADFGVDRQFVGAVVNRRRWAKLDAEAGAR